MTPPAAAPRSLLPAARAGALAAFVLFLLLLTYGRPWHLFPTETLGNFYDAQAESFAHGHLAVDPAEVTFEGFLVDGRTYEYQGPVPALMRLPIVLITDRFHGRLTRVSLLAAYAVSLWFLVRLQLLARRVVRGRAPIGGGERWWTGLTTFALGASSLLFLASKAWVYHEALLWGVAFSLGAFLHLGTWLSRPLAPTEVDAEATPPQAEPWFGHRSLVLATVFAGLALLTRSAVGAGPMAALVLCAGVQAAHWWSSPRRARLADGLAAIAGWRRTTTAGVVILALGVVVPVGAYAAINEAKFGTLFSLPADKQVLVQHDPTRQAFFASNGNSLFGAKYVPSVAAQALRPDAVSLGGPFPFVGFPRTRPVALGGTLFAERDWSSSVTDSEPLLVLLGLVGLAALVAPRRLAPDGDVAVLRLPVLGAVAGGAGFFAIGYMANRYMNDLFPLVALGAVIGIQVVGARAAGWSGAARRVLTVGLAALALWGAWVNVGIGTEYQRVVAPGATAAQRADWLRTQARLGPTPATVRVGLLGPLPARPPLGQAAIVGACDAVYRSNGSIWLPLEGGPRAGRFAGTLRLRTVPTREVTLLVGRAGAEVDRLVLTPVGGGQVRFAALVSVAGHETRSLPGPPVALRAGQAYPVAITFDWRSGYAEVRQGDRELLASTIALVPAVARVDAGFPGTLELDRPSTRTCRAIGG